MTEARIEMPNGETLRVASKKRYIVAVWDEPQTRWAIAYRSDNRDHALAQWRHRLRLRDVASLVDREARQVIR